MTLDDVHATSSKHNLLQLISSTYPGHACPGNLMTTKYIFPTLLILLRYCIFFSIEGYNPNDIAGITTVTNQISFSPLCLCASLSLSLSSTTKWGSHIHIAHQTCQPLVKGLTKVQSSPIKNNCCNGCNNCRVTRVRVAKLFCTRDPFSEPADKRPDILLGGGVVRG